MKERCTLLAALSFQRSKEELAQAIADFQLGASAACAKVADVGRVFALQSGIVMFPGGEPRLS